MSVAYIIQACPGFDFEPAFKHATTLATILPKGDISHFSESRILTELNQRLLPVKSQDFIILSGDPELIALTMVVLSRRLSVIQLLKYDRIARTYNLRKHSL